MSERRVIVTLTPTADPEQVRRAVIGLGWSVAMDLSAARILILASERAEAELVGLDGVAAVEPDRAASAIRR